jgi:hypothetical protein
MWRILKPPCCCSSNPARCSALPSEVDAQARLPSFDLLQAANSWYVFTATIFGFASSRNGEVAREDDRRELALLVADVFVERRVDRHPAGADEDRVAVWLRLRDHLRPDVAVRAGLVLDEDRLPPFLVKLLRDQPRDHVRAAARAEWYDDPDRAVRIRLCVTDAGAQYQCGDQRREPCLH